MPLLRHGADEDDDEGLDSRGNKGVKEGLLPKTAQDFVDRMKPEACYFTAESGKRTAYFVFDLKDPTLIPSVA